MMASSLRARPTLFSHRTSTPDRWSRMAATPSVEPRRDSALSDVDSSARIRTTRIIGLPSCGADSICNPLRVSSDAVDHHRGHREQEVQADEIEPGLTRDDAAIVLRLAVGPEHRQVDPREAWMEPRAPHDVGDVEHPPVLEERQPISNAGDAR